MGIVIGVDMASGGKREGAGRKPVFVDPVRITIIVERKDKERVKKEIKEILKK